jgi:type I restriction enzyme, S subunit
MAFKVYPEYKKSGVPWIGNVPASWEARKFRSLLFPIAKRNRADLPLLSVVREKGVIIRNVKDDSENHNVIPEDLTNYKVVQAGQFAMNKMKAWQGSYGISKYEGIVSPAYFVFELRNVEPSFFHAAVRSKAYVPFFTAASDGVRVGQWDLSLDRMREIPFYVPPLPEQTHIARFLDFKTAQINRFIKAKKRLIELLKEQKQAIINDAVTGKIDVTTGKPYPKYKDSGVEWLGKVPDGWAVKKGKAFFIEVDVRSVTGEEELLSVSHITGITPRSLKNITMFKSASYIGSKLCHPGQIAVMNLA